MEGKRVLEFSFKRSNQVQTQRDKSCVKVDGESVLIDPQLLFQRLTIAATGLLEDLPMVFNYELCSYPSSLFEASGLPRAAQKASLADCFWSMRDCGIAKLPDDLLTVLDGGSLLQRISWNVGDSFANICQTYVQQVTMKYADSVVVFDGYTSKLSTKDVTHIRRSNGATAQKVDFTKEMPCRMKKELFLSNIENKQHFIDLLGSKLQQSGCTTVHSDEDADLLITQTAVNCAAIKDVVVVGEGTDLLVLLCYHAGRQNHAMYLESDCKRSLGKEIKVWDIGKTKEVHGNQCSLFPMLHALSGCDKTSRLFGIGKGPAFKKLQSSDVLQDHARVFLDSTSDVDAVASAGEEILTAWYGGQPFETLDLLRFRRFAAKTHTGVTSVKVHTLPPTSIAARFHCIRSFLQCQCWIGNGCNFVPQNWGLFVKENYLLPVKCTMPPAPEQLL
ncbi:uncharacterized protein LOC117315643 [Pecten maximus]|uniref:uncharacterized protein LOC117315643 n=1 Tax=Pecten maximus TaxID=6579 RepID=UPI0014580CBD|nr:uncharacterized protein LOC117315643 [Pecten maximus]